MRCPTCHNRIAKAETEGMTLFARRMMIRKSDGALIVICQNCKTACVADEDVRAALRGAVILRAS
jgi:hypothetical protein